MMNRQTAPRRLATLGVTLLLAALAPATGAFAASAYTITDFGAGSTPSAVNESGQVAGQTGSGTAFLYNGGVMNTFLGNTYSAARGLNNQGHVVGYMEAGTDGFTHAFVYDGATVTDILPDISNFSQANGINDSGQVVGGMDLDFSAGYSPFLYDHASNTLESIRGVEASGNTGAFAINESGQFVVNYIDNSGPVTSFGTRLYDNSTTFTDLPLIPGSENQMESFALNNQGHMAGVFALAGGGANAFFYDGASAIGLGAGTFRANGLNDQDQIVGTGDGGAFLYHGATLHSLNALLDPGSGWVLEDALDINNLGQIVGTGSLNGESHGFLLTPTPVPLPAAVWLFGSGLAGLVGLARRRMTA